MKTVLSLLLAGCMLFSSGPGREARSGGASVAAPADRAVILACGDLIPHYEIYADTKVPGGLDLLPLLGDVPERVAAADYAFCTLETTIGTSYSFYPQFCAPEEYVRDLKTAGFDLLCLASNHCCDRKYPGIVSTVDACEKYGIDHTGVYRTQEERDADRGLLFKEINGIRFAFLDYTYGTNKYRMAGQEWAVRTFYTDFWSASPMVPDLDGIREDVAYAREQGAEIVLVVAHWGIEYQTRPNASQRELAEFLIREGADVIIGSHPHVPQSAEVLHVQTEDGTERTGWVFYSLGNFLSSMTNQAGDVTPMVEMTFDRDPASGAVSLTYIDWTPLYRVTDRRGDPAYRLVDAGEVLSAYDAGNAPAWFSPYQAGLTAKARALLLSIVGTEIPMRPPETVQ